LQSTSASAGLSGRVVQPELLDDLPPDDPRARRSRRDLQRIHLAMRSVSILLGAIARLHIYLPPRRILDLGSGDGELLLRLLRTVRTDWPGGEVTFLDRNDLIGAATRAELAALGWRVRVLRADAIEWARSANPEHFDLCLTTLFLHHLQPAHLANLLRVVPARADAFVACEPRRNTFSRIGSRLVAVLGANDVTRHDAVTSVAAGFTARELSSLWMPRAPAWQVDEYFAWPFTHCFAARRLIASL
jgi:SAM-dependent methyltransferase